MNDSIELPSTLHELLRVALDDMRKCMNSGDYVLDMDVWHSVEMDTDGRCHVCMAGAVMAQTLKTPLRDTVVPYTFPGINYGRLQALNSMRIADFRGALHDVREYDDLDVDVPEDKLERADLATLYYDDLDDDLEQEARLAGYQGATLEAFPGTDAPALVVDAWINAWENIADKLKELNI